MIYIDIHAVLSVTEAQNKLKNLWLDGCNKLVGHGLEPLRNSIVVKRIGIDLALESISTACVSSILDSIVGMTGNSLHEIEVTNIVLAKEDLELRKLLKVQQIITL